MKRLLWLGLIFGGGVAALMIASIVLIQQGSRLRPASGSDDLRTPVERVRQALLTWDYDALAAETSDVSREVYDRMFSDVRSGGPAARIVRGTLSAMEAFPSVRFAEFRPRTVEVDYEVKDGRTSAAPRTRFVLKPKQGYFLERLAFPVSSDDNDLRSPIVFRPGESPPIRDLTERLISALAEGRTAEFRSLMALDPSATDQDVYARLDAVRGEVMGTSERGVETVRKLIPEVGPLPRGTVWLRVLAEGELDGKPLRLEVKLSCGTPPRFITFSAGVGRK